MRKKSQVRYAEVDLETPHTRVRVVLDFDGERNATVETGIGYFDSLLVLFAQSAEFDLGVSSEGDLMVDDRHTLENVGACLGKAVRQALGAKGEAPFKGSFTSPMEDALCMAVVDFSNKGFLHYGLKFSCERLGGISTECLQGFFSSFTRTADMTLHLVQMHGHNNHHICEAAFKAFGSALKQAIDSGQD